MCMCWLTVAQSNEKSAEVLWSSNLQKNRPIIAYKLTNVISRCKWFFLCCIYEKTGHFQLSDNTVHRVHPHGHNTILLHSIGYYGHMCCKRPIRWNDVILYGHKTQLIDNVKCQILQSEYFQLYLKKDLYRKCLEINV